MSFKVIVDSCCDLTPSLLREDAFLSVPLSIRVGDRVFTDDAALDRPELLWQMQQSPEPPQTACPSPAQYLDAFACGAGELYVVTLSALLSGSHNSAQQARQIWLEEHPETRIHIFNSCSASSGEVLLALKVRALAAAGLPFQKVVQEASRFCQDMQTLFVLESLETLRKNGRLSGVQSVVTAALRIKLLMGATPEGSICKRGQALSMKQALVKMAELMAADPGHQGRLLVLAHCDCLDRVFQFKDMIRARCGFSDILVCEAGGVSTVYANRGGIVAAY
ncbi:DegV family protein [uncultured Intestinimonas sp.]|uniref:DegV family protein n=1 Tax=uncultured Intestinimonas sp. TaxID=1689265 RepID=UPI0025CE806C|nr:DegV family protein [uncultured Intestinimonas sp.]